MKESYTAAEVLALVTAERNRCAELARAELADANDCGNADAADAARRILTGIESHPSLIPCR